LAPFPRDIEGLKCKDMAGCIKHHLKIAGVKEQLFPDKAILAIHQVYNLQKGRLETLDVKSILCFCQVKMIMRICR